MAKPRVFVSSTYYDLKHVRSSLDIFIESLGYDSVLSEKGDIAYSPDVPLDDSCYKEVSNADIFILIVGGRYGSEASDGDRKRSKEFYERYESVTKKEFSEAIKRDIPTYVLVEQSVYSEYHTYLRNKENTKILYAHVDSVNIFKFIEEILALPRNNPTQTFEKFSDIEFWLREQWAGLFRELLKKMSDQKQFSELSQQVEGLKEINNTLKIYLESVMHAVSPKESSELIANEEKRLIEKKKNEEIKNNPLIHYISSICDLELEIVVKVFSNAKSFNDFAERIATEGGEPNIEDHLIELFQHEKQAAKDMNQVREILGLSKFKMSGNKKNLTKKYS